MGLLGSLLGSDQQKAISSAYKQASGQLQTGYNQQQQYYGQAANAYNPFVQQGQQANAFYGNALGLNGDAARASAENTITSDPLFTGALNLQNSNTLAYLNARGSAGSGAAVQAAQNNLYQNYGNALDRYANLGAQGLQATGAQAGVYQGQGNNAYGYGAQQAANSIGYGNAKAQADNIGINNLLGLGGLAIGGYNALVNRGGYPQSSQPYAGNSLYNLNTLK